MIFRVIRRGQQFSFSSADEVLEFLINTPGFDPENVCERLEDDMVLDTLMEFVLGDYLEFCLYDYTFHIFGCNLPPEQPEDAEGGK